MFKVLDVGSGKNVPLPPIYQKNFSLTTLDVDSSNGADIVCDLLSLPQWGSTEGTAREELKAAFDSLYLSHVLEHFPPSQTIAALRACRHVLKEDGFMLIRIPSIELLCGILGQQGKGFLAPLCDFTNIPEGVTGHDLIFGLEDHPSPFMKHRRHFTLNELKNELGVVGFDKFIGGYYKENLEILAICYTEKINPDLRKLIQEMLSGE